MIVALFCVAAAMIAGGAWAVFTGWELIIIERGWTQVLLGGMLITGGLLLGGVGVLATHVKRLSSKLDNLSGSRAGDALTPSLAADFGMGRRDPTAEPVPRQEPQAVAQPTADASRMPPPPPRTEPRVEPGAEPVADIASQPGEEPAGPAISAPAAIALGAAAGAGTAAIASSLLSSGARPPPGEELVGDDEKAEDVLADGTPTEEEPGAESLREPATRPASAALDEAGEASAIDGEIPSPDREVAGIATDGEEQEALEPDPGDLESEILEAEGAKADVLHGADGGVREQDNEEPVAAPFTLPESEPESEPEVLSTDSSQEAQEPAWRDTEATPPREEADAERVGAHAEARDQLQAEAPGERLESQESSGQQPVQHERSLVGTYESGGNVYTMYSDGSIDAQTPSGTLHFASLDELKNFIAEGGEDPLS